MILVLCFFFDYVEETVEEETTDEDTVFEEVAFEKNDVVSEEASVFEEAVVTEEVASEETAAASSLQGSEGLIYTGEPQELIIAQEGYWTYSLDGEQFSEELPTAVNAGAYTVYAKEGEGEPVVIVVTIAKADATFTPPVPNATVLNNG